MNTLRPQGVKSQKPQTLQLPDALYTQKPERYGTEVSFRVSELRSWKNDKFDNPPQVESVQSTRKTYVEILEQDFEVIDENFDHLKAHCPNFGAESLVGRRHYGFMLAFAGDEDGKTCAQRFCHFLQCYTSPVQQTSTVDVRSIVTRPERRISFTTSMKEDSFSTSYSALSKLSRGSASPGKHEHAGVAKPSILPIKVPHLHHGKVISQRRGSGGSDDMSISTGRSASQVPSIASSKSIARCSACKGTDMAKHNPLLRCACCRRHYHPACHKPAISLDLLSTKWTCSVCSKRLSKGDNLSTGSRTLPPTPQIQLQRLQAAEARTNNGNSHVSPTTPSSTLATGLLQATLAPPAAGGAIVRKSSDGPGRETDSTSPGPQRSDHAQPLRSTDKHILTAAIAQHDNVVASPEQVTLPYFTPGNDSKTISTQLDPSSRIPEQTATSAMADNTPDEASHPSVPADAASPEISHAALSTGDADGISKTSKGVSMNLESGSAAVASNFVEEHSSASGPGKLKGRYIDMIRAALESSPNKPLEANAVIEYIIRREASMNPKSISAHLSMGKNSGRFVQHKPDPSSGSASRRFTWSLPKTDLLSNSDGGRATELPLKPNTLPGSELRPHRSSALRHLALDSPTSSSQSHHTGAEDDNRTLPPGAVRYRVRSKGSSAYRIVAKNGSVEWDDLPRITRAVGGDNTRFEAGDIVKVMTETFDDEFGLIFDVRRASDDLVVVAILWCRNRRDLPQVQSHKNRPQWPEGFEYMLSNEVDVIYLKTVERKADALEKRSVFLGPKIWDCSSRTPLIRDINSKEVAWVLSLIGPYLDNHPEDASGNVRPEIPAMLSAGPNEVTALDSPPSTSPNERKGAVLGKRKRGTAVSLLRVQGNADVTDNGGGELIAHESNDRSAIFPPTDVYDTDALRTTKKRKIKSSDSASPLSGNRKTAGTMIDVGVSTSNADYAAKGTHADSVPSSPKSQLPMQQVKSTKSYQAIEQELAMERAEITLLQEALRELMKARSVDKLPTPIFDDLTSADHQDAREPPAQEAIETSAKPTPSLLHNVEEDGTHGVRQRPLEEDIPDYTVLGMTKQLELESLEREEQLHALQQRDLLQEAEINALNTIIAKQSHGVEALREAINGCQSFHSDNSTLHSKHFFNVQLSSLDDPDNKHPGYQMNKSVAQHGPHLKCQKKKNFGKWLPRGVPKPDKFGEAPCPELREVLGIPEGHVLSSHQGKLVYRDGTRDINGRLLRPDAIFPLQHATTSSAVERHELESSAHI